MAAAVAAWAAFEVVGTVVDVASTAYTAYQYTQNQATGAELAASVAGTASGVVSPGAGQGILGKAAVGLGDEAVSAVKAGASKGSATFHRYDGPDLGPTQRHVTVEIKDAEGASLGEFHQTGAGRQTTIEPIEGLQGTRTTSSEPYPLDDPQAAADFGASGFEAGKYQPGKNDRVTGACAIANQGDPSGGQISPAQVRSALDMR